MKEAVLHLFEQYPQLAVLISLVLSIVVAVLGLIPSAFITAANILFFGFWQGTLISFAGEAIGAIMAFILYRRGFKKTLGNRLMKFPRLQALLQAENKKAFSMIVSLRLVPFVPSGLVTLAAAMGKVSALTFFFASSLGKIPALLLEAYSVYQITEFGWQGKIILGIVAIVVFYFVVRRMGSGPYSS